MRDIVVFPFMIVPLFVGRTKSIAALEKAVQADGMVFLMAQKNTSDENPDPAELYEVGTVAKVLQMLKLPDGTVKVLVEGLGRSHAIEFLDNPDFLQAVAEPLMSDMSDKKEIASLAAAVLSQFENYIKLNKKIAPEILVGLNKIEDPERLADTISAHLSNKLPEKQDLLKTQDVAERLQKVFALMEAEISLLTVERRIRNRVKKQIEKNQREYFLNEQIRAIQKELGDTEEGKNEFEIFENKIKTLKLTKEAREKALGDLKKLKLMPPLSAEATVIRNYLDWIVDLPWQKKTKLNNDLSKSFDILDQDHDGLNTIKDRIAEYLAVQQRTGKTPVTVLCFVGPPGVGKTSLAKSIARATGREFVRLSVGGMRDEAEIRGHRRTYIGSMPGKLLQGMKKAGSSNPLFLIDEIDKMGHDHRGDPASALLEVLDPEQNTHFQDHYLEVGYDLSDVMFVCTANTLSLPLPLLDRMEIIRLSGYTEDEKVTIAQNHLLPRQGEAHGLSAKEWTLSEPALRDIIRYYTREAGVRHLERALAKIARKIVKQLLVTPKNKTVAVTPETLSEYLGIPKYRFGLAEDEDQIGVATGLAWTEVGGDLLAIETVMWPGKGKVKATGKLGDVMQESLQAAMGYIRSQALTLGIAYDMLDKRDIHLHLPEGATPKDGPSAGIALATALISMLTNIPVRRDVAMTGEITLRGRVLPIGGLKEKLLAALRGGITTVLIPKQNEKDLADIPSDVQERLTIIPVGQMAEVLVHAFTKPLTPIAWPESQITVDYVPQMKGAPLPDSPPLLHH
ncbi:MAG: endopeptidase La [Alphaproteobacteria bacterium]